MARIQSAPNHRVLRRQTTRALHRDRNAYRKATAEETACGDTIKLFLLSKQELYVVKENYEIFSTRVPAREKQGQSSGGPHQGVIGSL